MEELPSIYLARGLEEPLARLVAEKLMVNDALGAHSRDELGFSETMPTLLVQAAIASAMSFAVGAMIPFIAALLAPSTRVAAVTSATALVTLVVLGGSAAYAGGTPVARGSVRVTFWGALAMAVTAGAGRFFGAAI